MRPLCHDERRHRSPRCQTVYLFRVSRLTSRRVAREGESGVFPLYSRRREVVYWIKGNEEALLYDVTPWGGEIYRRSCSQVVPHRNDEFFFRLLFFTERSSISLSPPPPPPPPAENTVFSHVHLIHLYLGCVELCRSAAMNTHEIMFGRVPGSARSASGRIAGGP